MIATVQVWAKGSTAAGRSPEFDRVVPLESAELEGLENRLHEFGDWGGLIEPLYRLGRSSTARQFVALFDDAEFLTGAVAHSEDQHGRLSVVFVAARVASIDWQDSSLVEHIGKAHGLCVRLATSYSQTLAGMPQAVAAQVRSGTFLPDRRFRLGSEQEVERLDWERLISETRRWRGVSGIATPALARLGANVLYGTRDEVNRAAVDNKVGAYDIAKGRIEPIGDFLQLWGSRQPSTVPDEQGLEREGELDQQALRRLELALSELRDATFEIRDLLIRLVHKGGGRGKRKGR